jgi:hypothetical protein
VHAAYDMMLLLAFGHAFPVAPTPAGFLVDTVVNLCLAGVALILVGSVPRRTIRERQAA